MIAKFKEIMGIDCCKHKEEIKALKLEHMALLRDQQRMLEHTIRDLAEAKAIQHFTMSQSENKIKALEEEIRSENYKAEAASAAATMLYQDSPRSPRRTNGRKKKRSTGTIRVTTGSQDQD